MSIDVYVSTARDKHIKHARVQRERELAADADPAHRGSPGAQGSRQPRHPSRVDG